MTLKIKLKPNDKIVVNGAVISNQGKSAVIGIENQALILHQRDVMQEKDATTPVRRAYFSAQMLLIEPFNPDTQTHYTKLFEQFLGDLDGVFVKDTAREMLKKVHEAYQKHDYYKVLSHLKKLFTYEDALLNYQKFLQQSAASE